MEVSIGHERLKYSRFPPLSITCTNACNSWSTTVNRPPQFTFGDAC